MKKILFVGITALAMASCTHDDYAPVSKQEQYQAVFEKEFGTVNPNVNGDSLLSKYSHSTRMASSLVLVVLTPRPINGINI